MQDNKIKIYDDNNKEIELEILDVIKLENIDYYLMSDDENLYIMQNLGEDNEDLNLEFVSDENKLSVIADLFNNSQEEIELEL